MESELAKLKRMDAVLSIENQALKDLIKKALTPYDKRAVPTTMHETHSLSAGRCCQAVGLARSAYYQTPLDWQTRDAEIVEALNQ